MKVVNFRKAKADKQNILVSLEYLTKEAQIGGYAELYSILNNALNSARDKNIKHDAALEDIPIDVDSHRIIELLVRFKEAPKETQKEILDTLEYLETCFPQSALVGKH